MTREAGDDASEAEPAAGDAAEGLRPVQPPVPAATRRPVLIAVVAVAVLAVAIAIVSGVLGGTPTATNPVPATTDSIARGASTYANDCAKCHGADGRGGGSLSGTTAVPPPALTGPSSHLGQHSDAELFAFIRDGLPGGMPSWGGQLKDDDIWDVINFLHSLRG